MTWEAVKNYHDTYYHPSNCIAYLYGQFEVEYAQNPGVLLVAYLDGNYVGTSALSGLDTTRVLGHHAVGVMWNIEEWTLDR